MNQAFRDIYAYLFNQYCYTFDIDYVEPYPSLHSMD